MLKDINNRLVHPSRISFYDFPKNGKWKEDPNKFLAHVGQKRRVDKDTSFFYLSYPYWFIALSPKDLRRHKSRHWIQRLVPPHVFDVFRKNQDEIETIARECERDGYDLILDCYGKIRRALYAAQLDKERYGDKWYNQIKHWDNVTLMSHVPSCAKANLLEEVDRSVPAHPKEV